MKAQLLLEDGTCFEGEQFGSATSSAGEVVFNTGMVGYPEAMTDPSYAGQILVLTYPLIGNYGVPLAADGHASSFLSELSPFYESNKIHVKSLVISTLAREYSHWSAAGSLDAWMQQNKVPGICGVDTRALTKQLRVKGCMLGKVVVDDKDTGWEDPNTYNIVAEVSVSTPQWYPAEGGKKCILVDFGAKNNIVRCLNSRGISVLKVGWNHNWLQEEADGIVLSNGPGDPKKCIEAIEIIRKGLDRSSPILGICLGHQLLALAAGGDTYKLKYGHRGQNQPCIQVGSKRYFITSQNHGFAVNEQSLDGEWEPWLFNANDGTNEGIRHRHKPFYSIQFHPEATPGPSDTNFFFDNFANILDHERKTS